MGTILLFSPVVEPRVAPADVADLYALPTDALAAVEVDRGPSEIPLELSGADARCAVVGLWTQGAE